MAETVVLKTTFQFRRGNASAWTRNNPTLTQGEPGYELDTGKLKIGDGVSNWRNLKYFNGNFELLTDGTLRYTIKNNLKTLGLVGFDEADEGTIPIKQGGALTWTTPLTTTDVENLITSSTSIQDLLVQKIQAELNNTASFKFKGAAAHFVIDEGIITLQDENYEIIHANPGDVYSYDGREYLWDGVTWSELGDETLKETFATKAELNNLTTIVNSIQNSGGVLATNTTAGTVLGSQEMNQISVDEDGHMNINTISIDKLVQNNIELILDGGSVLDE